MARSKVRLDFRGIETVATRSDMDSAIEDAAEAIAANVRGMGIKVGDKDGGPREVDLPVKVFGPDDTTGFRWADRSRARVSLAHPAGEAVQAKHGALTKAAAEAGLDFRAR